MEKVTKQDGFLDHHQDKWPIIIKTENDHNSATMLRLKTALYEYIRNSSNMPELSDLLTVCKRYTKDTNYYCGKGGHHIWVRYADYNNDDERVLFIVVK